MQDLQHKHWALIAVGVLVAVLIVLILWFTLHTKKVVAPINETATSTLVAAMSTTVTDVPAHITENSTYFEIDLRYPSITPLSAGANAKAVASMRAAMQDVANQFKTSGNFVSLTHDDVQMMGLDQRKEALESNYTVYTGNRTVSYVFEIYEDTLGAHPNAYFRTFTFDTTTGDELSLSTMFSSSNYLSILSNRVRSDLPLIIKSKSGYDADLQYMQLGTDAKVENFSNFAVDGTTLRIIFAPYQIGPWSLGTIVDPIPLSSLSTSLKAQYVP